MTAAANAADFSDKQADVDALPTVPAALEVTLCAREPLVRQPCSMAFDARGRLFVGMGPQYRNSTPETPGDSVVMVLDTDLGNLEHGLHGLTWAREGARKVSTTTLNLVTMYVPLPPSR